jgi:hypothetical protein
MRYRLLVTVLAFFLAPSLPVSGATRTWIGFPGNPGKWSTASNWKEGAAPVNGDRIAFTLDMQQQQSQNDIPNLTLDAIDIGFALYPPSLNGLAITLTNPAAINAKDLSGASFVGIPVVLPPNAAITGTNGDHGAPPLSFGDVTLGGGANTIKSTGSMVVDSFSHSAPSSLSVSVPSLDVDKPIDIGGPFTFTGDSLSAQSGWANGSATITARLLQMLWFADGDIETPFELDPAPGGSFTLELGSKVFKPLRFTGPVTLGPAGSYGNWLVWPGIDAEFSNVISGDGTLWIDAHPLLRGRSVTLSSGRNTFAGQINVGFGGKLVLANTGSMPPASALMIASDGSVTLASGVQTSWLVNCSGHLEIVLGAILHSEITTLDGCTLQLDVPAGFSFGSGPFTLIANDGGVIGTFAGLPEGAPIVVGGTTRYITYKAGGGGDVALLASPGAPSGHGKQDMWWQGESGNGWGLSLIEHGNTLFGALYIYDQTGRPTWVVLPGGTWDSTGTVYSGPVYRPSGTPYFAYDAARLAVGSAVGSISISFDPQKGYVLSYTIDGVSGVKPLIREIFAVGQPPSPDRSDLWWGGSAQNGWGITVLQQDKTLFAVWFTYDASGKATWYVMPGGTWTSADTYEGSLYSTTGSQWAGAIYDASKLQVHAAGTFKFQFTGDNATFTYSADGKSGTLPLAREPF